MRFFPGFLLIWSASLCAQTVAPPPPPANEPPPETVLASFEGRKLTYAELKRFLSVLDPKQQQLAIRNPKPLIHQYFLWQELAAMALKEKLDERSPTKEQIEYNRTYLLMQAKLNDVVRNMKVAEDDLKKYYEANKDKYSQVRVKALYVSFSNNPDPGAGGKKVLTEEEAKTKIEKILAEIRGGADFVKMVKQHSEDTTSAEKDGDFATIRRSDTVPEAVRAAVFALKQAQVSEPVRQPNGFYLFRAEEITSRSYQQMQLDILEEVRQVKSKEWMEKLNTSVDFKVENEAFFKAAESAAPAPQSPAVAPPPKYAVSTTAASRRARPRHSPPLHTARWRARIACARCAARPRPSVRETRRWCSREAAAPHRSRRASRGSWSRTSPDTAARRWSPAARRSEIRIAILPPARLPRPP